MNNRTVAFPPDGTRIYVQPRDVAAAWRAATRPIVTVLGPLTISARYAVGTAQRESDFSLNEVDTEPSGFVSTGIFQLSDDERQEVKLPGVDMTTLDGSISVMVPLSQRRMISICQATVNIGGQSITNALRGDLYAYLAIAHNEGLHAALKSIGRYGLDWLAWKTRNPHLSQMGYYGDDCITGGALWP